LGVIFGDLAFEDGPGMICSF